MYQLHYRQSAYRQLRFLHSRILLLGNENDFKLENFTLAKEDLELKIPYLLKALELSKGDLKLFASPWSAPGWMKTNGHMKGGGHLKGEFNGPYYRTYAKYFVSSVQQRDFAYHLLSPALKASQVGEQIKIMAHDDRRSRVLSAAKDIYNDSAKAAAIDGLGVHWYTQSGFEPLTQAHLLTCTGYGYGPNEPLLGHWDRGQQYGFDILNNLKNWVIGWTDWNMALDLQDEFYKQPMFYFLGHFSKFVPRGSVRIHSQVDPAPSPSVEHVAFNTPNGNRVLVMINMHENQTFNVSIEDTKMTGKTAKISLQPKSINTVVWARGFSD
uniref:Glucosylceramidase n=1 Tax=Ditylenchus dipsaci TaxID=166011 RepID=A0A915E4C5_9BILA